MKTQKILIFLIIGILGVLIFSFKTQEPIKEYAMMRTCKGYIKEKSIAIHFSSETKYYPFKTSSEEEMDSQATKLINELLRDGWNIISTDAITPSAGSPVRIYHFERSKK